MIDQIKLHDIQSSPVTLISQANLNEVMVVNMCMIAEKLNELILTLNSGSIKRPRCKGIKCKEPEVENTKNEVDNDGEIEV